MFFHDCLTAAVRGTRALAGERDVTLEATLATVSNGDAAVQVLGDPAQLGAMMEGVMRRALRSWPQGSRLELDVQVHEDAVALNVLGHREWGPAAAGAESPDADGAAQGPGAADPQDDPDTALAERVALRHRATMSMWKRAEGGYEFQIQLPRWRA